MLVDRLLPDQDHGFVRFVVHDVEEEELEEMLHVASQGPRPKAVVAIEDMDWA
jgi:hypothetical protein